MNVVVEARKRYRKICVDYEKKAELQLNKILQLQLETISNSHVKSKIPVAAANTDDVSRDLDAYAQEMHDRQRRLELLRKQLEDTKKILQQLSTDEVAKKANKLFNAEVMLAQVKSHLNKELIKKE